MNFKFEARNTKHETNTNDRNSNIPNNKFRELGHWDFEFVSVRRLRMSRHVVSDSIGDFDIRISDFYKLDFKLDKRR